jgi:hypothetical protein
VAKTRATDKTIRIGRDLRVASAEATYSALRKAAAAGLQALYAGRDLLARAGKTVGWAECSPQLAAAAALLGLVDALELPK